MGKTKTHNSNGSTNASQKSNQKMKASKHSKRDVHKGGELSVDEKKYMVLVIVIALVIGFLHSQHVAGMFERQRFFSHLSTLERELSFRTEMGLYYSYYKTMSEAPSVISGVSQLIQCNITEFPDEVNVLRRFNLYPELVLGILHRMYIWFGETFDIKLQKCYSITRGQGMSSVQSCVGMGDIAHFYVYPIFWLSGIMLSFFFIAATYLSGNILGGFVAVMAYFFNHGECTRVMWTPPLRESFSFPFLIMQMFTVMHLLKCRNPTWKHSLVLSIVTALFMLPWQFAQFALLTQVCALFALYLLKFINAERITVLLNGLLLAHGLNFVAQFANTLLISSFFMAAMLAALVVVNLENQLERLPHRILIWACQGSLFLLLSLVIKISTAKLFQIKDDAHIFDILRSKFTDFHNFHTLLYVCAPEFDFIGFEFFKKISKTLLFPSAVVCGLFLLAKILKNEWRFWIKGEALNGPEEGTSDQNAPKPYTVHFYMILQAIAFMIMSVMIMRLKLFGTPSLCLVASLLASRDLFGFIGKKTYHFSVVFIILGLMSMSGYKNLKSQLNVKGEYSNPNLENLIEWINANTEKNSVFAGAMPTMAAVKLSTGRPIVNHPHYEDSGVRARTMTVYQLYSRKPKELVHEQIKNMGVTHLIMEDSWCTRRTRPGCALPEVWDIEDPDNKGKLPVCKIIAKTPAPFKIVYKNSVYVILQV